MNKKWLHVVLMLFLVKASMGCTSLLYVKDGSKFKNPTGSVKAVVENGTVIINGEKSRNRYDGIFHEQGVVFSQDGKTVAYIGVRNDKYFPVINEVEYGPYDNIAKNAITLAAKGNRFAVSVINKEKWILLIDGTETTGYDSMARGSPVFSNDGKHIAYAVKAGDKWLVIKDGVENNRFDGISKGSPAFRFDNKLIYLARINGRWQVYIDDYAGDSYDLIYPPWVIVSAEGMVGFVGERDGKRIININGKEEEPGQDFETWKKTSGMREILDSTK